MCPITTPPPPHDGVLNAEEIEMCLETHHCQLAFDDDAYLKTLSVTKEKFVFAHSHSKKLRELVGWILSLQVVNPVAHQGAM